MKQKASFSFGLVLILVVLPGNSLGTEEEFLAGVDTFVEGVDILSTQSGEQSIDSDHRVSVKAFKKPALLSPGMIVFGRVDEIFEPIALLRVIGIEQGGVRPVNSQFYCVLHVSRIKSGYAKNVRDEIKIGDIVKAVVDEIKNEEAHLSTKAPEYGVIKAFCSNCRSPLDKKERGLECPECGSKENRKLAPSYRSV